jgi:hypothetical protein
MKTKKLYICLMALFSITAFAQVYNEYSPGGGGSIPAGYVNQYTPTGNNELIQVNIPVAPKSSQPISYITNILSSLTQPVNYSSNPGAVGGGSSGVPPTNPTYIIPPTPLFDPCAEVKAQISNATYMTYLSILQGKTGETFESGYSQQINVQPFFTSLTAKGSDALDFIVTQNTTGFTHVHTDPYQVTESNGDVRDVAPIQMLSPPDVGKFLEIVKNAQSNNIPLEKIYGSMVSSAGTYELKFVGNNVGDAINTYTTTNFRSKKLDDAYRKAIKDYGTEGGLLNFLETTLNLRGVELMKIEKNGTVSKIGKDAYGKGVANPCVTN